MLTERHNMMREHTYVFRHKRIGSFFLFYLRRNDSAYHISPGPVRLKWPKRWPKMAWKPILRVKASKCKHSHTSFRFRLVYDHAVGTVYGMLQDAISKVRLYFPQVISFPRFRAFWPVLKTQICLSWPELYIGICCTRTTQRHRSADAQRKISLRTLFLLLTYFTTHSEYQRHQGIQFGLAQMAECRTE